MGAGIAKFDGGPFAALADDDVFDLAEAVWKGLAPAVVVGLVGVLTLKFFAARDILEVALLGDNFCAAIRVAHVPGFVELADGLFGWVHCQGSLHAKGEGWRSRGPMANDRVFNARRGAKGSPRPRVGGWGGRGLPGLAPGETLNSDRASG